MTGIALVSAVLIVTMAKQLDHWIPLDPSAGPALLDIKCKGIVLA